jgi:cytochrome c oxidase assembly protein subunit 15
VALVIVALLIYVLVRSQRETAPDAPASHAPAGALPWGFALVLALSLVQIVLGTQVRESVDEIDATGAERASWIEQLGGVYAGHRAFAAVVVAANLLLIWRLRRSGALGVEDRARRRLAFAVVGLLLVEAAVGVLLSALALPPFLQPIHLLFASLLVGSQFALATLGGWPRSEGTEGSLYGAA